MRYYVSLDPTAGGAPTPVDVVELPSGELEVTIDGKRVAVDVVAAPNALSVRVDGRVIDLTTEGQAPELGVVASGHRSYVRVESERQRAAAAARNVKGAGGEKVVKTPMPGRVIRLLVGANAEVAPGQTLCVIEAMKMENEVKAKTACTIATVHVTEGATVEGNARLFTLA